MSSHAITGHFPEHYYRRPAPPPETCAICQRPTFNEICSECFDSCSQDEIEAALNAR